MAEQQIDHSLTSLHDLIALQTLKLEVLKSHKKGLMQRLNRIVNIGCKLAAACCRMYQHPIAA